MPKKITLAGLTVLECKEIISGLGSRLKALDKSFKSCMVNEAQAAADKVADKIAAIKKLHGTVEEAMAEAQK